MTHSFPTRGLSDLDVGDFADRAFEQRGVFEQRQLDLAIAVGRKHFTGDTGELLPGRAVDRQYIIESADGLEKIRHVLELLCAGLSDGRSRGAALGELFADKPFEHINQLGVVRLVLDLAVDVARIRITARSEERRVGKECVRTCRSRWSAMQ